MKRLLIAFVLFGLFQYTYAQNFSAPKTFDASSYVTIPPIQTKSHSFNIDYVMCQHNYTAVHITVNVLTHRGGSLIIPSNTQIKPSMDGSNAYRIKSMLINKKKWSPGTTYYYYADAPKGSTIDLWLLFDRIPIDVEYIDYYDGGDIIWSNVPVVDNGNKLINTKLKRDDIMRLLAEKNPAEIEGIYEFVSCDNEKWWGKSSPCFGVLQQNEQEYRVVFLEDYNHCSPMWRGGFLKATIRATAVENFYRVSWFIDDGSSMNDLQITFSDGVMSVQYPKLDAEALFVKMYPISKSVKMQPSTPAGGNNREIGAGSQSQQRKEYKSQGSGIIISKDGMVVTNHHVVDGATEYDIIVKDGIGIYTYKADVIAVDKTNDLALLKINDKSFKQLSTIPYAINPKICSTGTQIYAMGYPISQYLGDEVKTTDGIISSITGYQGDVTSYQISAAIQPGSSGGPVFDSNGNLVGITVAGVRSAQNVGYAIKSSYLCLFIESSPIRIELPNNTSLKGLSLTEQIKKLSKYVVSVNVK